MEVSPRVLRRAVVGEDDPPDLLVVSAALEELHRRQAEPLLVDVGGVRGEAAWRLAANLGDVPDVAGEAEELVLTEDRHHRHVFGEVALPSVGVVVDNDVPRLEELLAELLERPAHRVGDRAHHRGRVVLLGDQVALAV